MNYEKAVLTLDRNYCIGQIDPRLRGSFVEHLGRAVYDGLYQYVHGLYTTASKNSTSNTCLLETSGVLLAMSPSIALHLTTPQILSSCLAAVQPLVSPYDVYLIKYEQTSDCGRYFVHGLMFVTQERNFLYGFTNAYFI